MFSKLKETIDKKTDQHMQYWNTGRKREKESRKNI